MNIVPSQGLRARASTARHDAGANSTAIFLLWVVLIFTQIISLSFAAAHHEDAGGRRLFRSPPRKERVFETPMPTPTLFQAPPSSRTPSNTTPAQVVANNSDLRDRETIYGDDKRVIHTGPNPLHN